MGHTAVYKKNIITGKKTRILDNEMPDGHYEGLAESDGKVYYVYEPRPYEEEQKLSLYMCCGRKDSKKVCSFDIPAPSVYGVYTFSGNIVIEYSTERANNDYSKVLYDDNIVIYNIKHGLTSKIEKIKNYNGLAYLAGDMLFYYSKKNGKESDYLSYMAYTWTGKVEWPRTSVTKNKVRNGQEVKEEKLSEIYNWDNAKITTDYYYPNFGEGQVLQNKDYVFYPGNGKIIRINKSDGKKKVVYKAKVNKNTQIHYCLAGNGIFTEYADNIYFCGFNGENCRKVISNKKLKKKITAIEDDGWTTGVSAIYFYRDNLYLVAYFCMYKLDLGTMEVTKMSESTMYGGCICGSTLYYINGRTAIYGTDINTGKSKKILGTDKASRSAKKYERVMELDGKVYYVQKQIGEKPALYMYGNGKKNKKICDFDVPPADVSDIMCDSGKIVIEYGWYTNYYNNVLIYDIKSSVASRIENIEDYYGAQYLAGDMMFYNKRGGKSNECLLNIAY